VIWSIIIGSAVAVCGYLIFSFILRKSGWFWRLAARNPDLAITLLQMEPHCLVDIPPPNATRRDYTGPFSLIDRASAQDLHPICRDRGNSGPCRAEAQRSCGDAVMHNGGEPAAVDPITSRRDPLPARRNPSVASTAPPMFGISQDLACMARGADLF
jgi:hypothetical protein